MLAVSTEAIGVFSDRGTRANNWLLDTIGPVKRSPESARRPCLFGLTWSWDRGMVLSAGAPGTSCTVADVRGGPDSRGSQ